LGGTRFWFKTKTPNSSWTGAGLSEGMQFFSAGIEPRRVNVAGDYFEFGLLPKIRGLYSEDALKNTELKYTKPEVGAKALVPSKGRAIPVQ
jgi:hypothetical protein